MLVRSNYGKGNEMKVMGPHEIMTKIALDTVRHELELSATEEKYRLDKESTDDLVHAAADLLYSSAMEFQGDYHSKVGDLDRVVGGYEL